jgi:hypothetical protein
MCRLCVFLPAEWCDDGDVRESSAVPGRWSLLGPRMLFVLRCVSLSPGYALRSRFFSAYLSQVQRHKINIFYTAPTAIRSLMAAGDAPVKKYDRSSLRVLGSVGGMAPSCFLCPP